ncbi:hypothetical protein Pmani_033222 [Petrolisthes manimaculis]|uniref:Saposin B-type domain-containing protein n=1 Tax=Petrolisthes manimaculis TaxID=1843537 RepID=A0AAE1NRW8_9EUCA|nr:hypothetical protein Pmani_033222 [Petrolisthes manimaculis]
MKGVLTTWMVLVVVVMVTATQKEDKPLRPKKQLPDDTLFNDPAAFCEGCYGMVHEAFKLLTLWKDEKGSLEEHIDATLLATCSTDRLRSYVLSPPKMMRLCSGIRAHYEEELGLSLMGYYSSRQQTGVDQLFEAVCKKAIPACPKGIQPMSIARKEKMKAAEEKRAKEEEEKNKQETNTQDNNNTKNNKGNKKQKNATTKTKEEL